MVAPYEDLTSIYLQGNNDAKTVYGLIENSYDRSEEQDTYDLGLLGPGVYDLNVQEATWDLGPGSDKNFIHNWQVLDSDGNIFTDAGGNFLNFNGDASTRFTIDTPVDLSLVITDYPNYYATSDGYYNLYYKVTFQQDSSPIQGGRHTGTSRYII